MLGFARRYWFPCGYVATYWVLSAASMLRGPRDHAAVQAWLSSNLDNLSSGRVDTLLTAALVAPGWPWLGMGLVEVFLFPLADRFGNRRALVITAAGNAIATAISEGALAARIRAGTAPTTDRAVLDVGPSYVLLAALAALLVFGHSRWWRAAALAVLIAGLPALVIRAPRLETTGHLASLACGAALAALCVRDERHRRRRATPGLQ